MEANTKLNIGIGIVYGLVSFSSFFGYFGKPVLQEKKALNNVAAYVQSYEGNNPSRALDSLQEELQITSLAHPDMKTFASLEKTVSGVNKDMKNIQNPIIYKPVLKNLGNLTKEAASQNGRSNYDLGAGIGLGIASSILLGMGITEAVSGYMSARRRKKEEEDKKKQPATA